MLQLRPHQERQLQQARDSFRCGNRALLLQGPTGSGKTVTASALLNGALNKGKRAWFIAHRRELVFQASERLGAFGVPHGVIMAGEQRISREVQVCSIQTLLSWQRRGKIGFSDLDLVVIDEAHRSLADSYRKIIRESGAAVIGLTATPMTGSGKGLGHVYDDLIMGPTYQELFESGILVRPQYFVPMQPNLEGVRTRHGDYVESELAERMDTDTLVGDVVEQWGKYASDRKTVVFASGVKHSMHLAECFKDAGIRAEHIDGTTPKEQRDGVLKDLSNGDLQVVCNCMVLTEGWDQPDVDAVVVARPTQSETLYIQMVGRGLRSSPGKEDCLVLDHAGVVMRHGRVEEFNSWELTDDEPYTARDSEGGDDRPIIQDVVCRECFHAYKPYHDSCPNCGAERPRRRDGFEHEEGSLAKLGDDGTVAAEEERRDARMKFYKELMHIAEQRGYKRGWVGHTYKWRYKDWPPKSFWQCAPSPASTETVAFVNMMNRKKADARRRTEVSS